MTTATANQIKIGNYQDIIDQLGNNKFLAMTGSKVLYYGYNNLGYVYLTIKLVKNQSTAQYLKIQLNGLDLYDLTFFRIKKILNKEFAELGAKIYDEEIINIKKYNNVYGNMLQDIFTDVTGMYTSLF